MRWRLTLLVSATTAAVVLAFLVPLWMLLRSLVEERTVALLTTQAQVLAASSAQSTGDGADDENDPGNDAADPNTSTEATGEGGATIPSLDAPGLKPIVSVVFPGGSVTGFPISPANPDVVRAQAGEPFSLREGDQIVVYAPAIGRRGTTVVRAAVEQADVTRQVLPSMAVLAGFGLALLLLATLTADTLARRVAASIQDLGDAADAIRDGALDTRTPERGPPEVVGLARALNRLAARIEQLLIAERESVADLSHRLRTPVTALRLDAESIGDRELAERLHQHVTNLERTVDAVVRDARRPIRTSATARCDVGQVVDERVTFWSALADEQGRLLRARLPARPAWARIDAMDLVDVVDVLMDNVFAHTDDGVPLEVTVQVERDRMISLTVEDGGPGLPGVDVVQRGRSSAGSSGLGLDIVRRAALASGGSLELGWSRLGGAQVRVLLGPAEQQAEAHQRGDRPARRRRRRRAA